MYYCYNDSGTPRLLQTISFKRYNRQRAVSISSHQASPMGDAASRSLCPSPSHPVPRPLAQHCRCGSADSRDAVLAGHGGGQGSSLITQTRHLRLSLALLSLSSPRQDCQARPPDLSLLTDPNTSVSTSTPRGPLSLAPNPSHRLPSSSMAPKSSVPQEEAPGQAGGASGAVVHTSLLDASSGHHELLFLSSRASQLPQGNPSPRPA